jgi:glyoxylase-like metal-dependent hydrolase (beta-lactamase superfamily II)
VPFCLIVLTFSASLLGQDLPVPNSHQYKIEQLAKGVYTAVRTEVPNLMVNANSTFIVTDDDVVVVDTGLTPSYAAELVQEIKKITPKPVTYVVNTHWHDDHIIGNAAFRDAYPGVQFIGHHALVEYLPTTGLENRKKMFTGAPPVIKQLRDAVAAGKTTSGGELSPEERLSYATSISMAERYMAEVPKTEVIVPKLAFEDQMVLQRGGRRIELRHFGRSHTAGDIIVYLPKEKIAIVGDLVIAPVPLIGSDQSYVGDWSLSLQKLLAMDLKTIVPGHGPVMHDKSYVRLLQQLMSSIDQQTRAAAARGETLEQARKDVNLEELRKKFAGDDKVLNFLFRVYVVGPGVAAAYREVKAQ